MFKYKSTRFYVNLLNVDFMTCIKYQLVKSTDWI